MIVTVGIIIQIMVQSMVSVVISLMVWVSIPHKGT